MYTLRTLPVARQVLSRQTLPIAHATVLRHRVPRSVTSFRLAQYSVSPSSQVSNPSSTADSESGASLQESPVAEDPALSTPQDSLSARSSHAQLAEDVPVVTPVSKAELAGNKGDVAGEVTNVENTKSVFQDTIVDGPPSVPAPSPEPEVSAVGSSAEPAPLPPLPNVPTEPVPKPAPFLTTEDIRTYLKPLYARGWFVQRRIALPLAPRHVLTLSKIMTFKDFRDAADFVSEWMKLKQSRTKSTAEPRTAIRIEDEHVIFVTYTQVGYNSSFKAGLAKSPTPIPGITLHDVRAALAIEHLWMEFIENDKTSKAQLPIPPNGLMPADLSKPQNAFLRCLACGGQHRLADCPRRAQIRPKKRCNRCKGDHWVADCVRCPACNGEHSIADCTLRAKIKPRAPCARCKGEHWAIDCPKASPSRQSQTPAAVVDGAPRELSA